MKYNRKIKALCLRDILRNLRQCLLSPHILDSKTSVDYVYHSEQDGAMCNLSI